MAQVGIVGNLNSVCQVTFTLYSLQHAMHKSTFFELTIYFLTAKVAVQQSTMSVLSVSESKEIFPHCNAPIISVPVL